MNKTKISPDFKNLIPPLSTEEFTQLEQNILQSGCLNAIKTWRGYIVDGHNRYAICQKHNIPYSTEKLRFATKDEAKLWIAENQLGRRNLSKAMLIEIASKKADILQNIAKQNGQPFSRRKTIAKAAGVGEETVHKYMKIVEHGSTKLINKVRNGETKINAAHKTLAVSTRRVEAIYNADDPKFKNSPISFQNVLCRIRDISKVYGELGVLDLGEGVGEVVRRLEGQLSNIR